MTDSTPGGGKGLLESLMNFASTLVAIVQIRLELLSTDLEDTHARVVSLLLLGLAAFFFIGVGVLLVTLLLVVAFWDSHRLLVLASLAGFYLVVGVAIAAIARHKARSRPRLFAASLAELNKDRQAISRR
jgi:uncharacterized membrane protein YqjE